MDGASPGYGCFSVGDRIIYEPDGIGTVTEVSQTVSGSWLKVVFDAELESGSQVWLNATVINQPSSTNKIRRVGTESIAEPHEGCIDLVQSPPEADGAFMADTALPAVGREDTRTPPQGILHQGTLFKTPPSFYPDWLRFNSPTGGKQWGRLMGSSLRCMNQACSSDRWPISEAEAFYLWARQGFFARLKAFGRSMYVCPFCGGTRLEPFVDIPPFNRRS